MKKDKILDDFLKTINKVDYEKTLVRMTIAKKISEGMIKKKISKMEFSLIMKQQPSIITRWLSGTHNFTVDTLVEIQNVLKIKLI